MGDVNQNDIIISPHTCESSLYQKAKRGARKWVIAEHKCDPKAKHNKGKKHQVLADK